jgi:glycine cleavage system H protein
LFLTVDNCARRLSVSRFLSLSLGETFSLPDPSDRKYKSSHEWVKLDGDVATVGITDHAQAALGEIVFADLPDVGTEFGAADNAAAVESVKAAGEIYAPIGGEVVEVNAVLEETPDMINKKPHDDGWMFKLKVADAGELDGLLDAAAYEASLAK